MFRFFLVYFIDLFVDFCDGCCSKWWTWYAGWSRDWGESFVAPPSSANLISPQDQTLKRKRMFFKVFFSSCMQSNLKTFPKTFLTYPLVLPVLRKHSYRLDNWSSHFLRQSITSQRTHRNLHPKNLSRKRFFNWDNPSGLVRSGAKLVPLSAWHDYTRRPLLLCPLIAKIHFICYLGFTNTFLASFFNFLISSMFYV